MIDKNLTGYMRTETKKGAVGRLRRNGMIPGVMYGHSEAVNVMVSEVEFEKKFYHVTENTIIHFHIDDKNHDVLVKDMQENTLKGKLMHIDFYEVEKGRLLRTRIPIHIVGTSKGVKEGGILDQSLYEVEVECLPNDIPEYFEIDVTEYDIGHSIHVADIEPPAGVTIITHLEYSVLSIATQKVELEPTEEDEEAAEGEEEVEVISAKTSEEESTEEK